MHPARSLRERFGEIGTAAQAHPELLRSADSAIPQDLPLASVSQAVAMSAREDMAAQVQLRHPPPAVLSAAEPGTRTTEVAPHPHELHALLDGFPLATSPESQDDSIGFGPHIDAS